MRFECIKCGKCCTGRSEVKFLPSDIEALISYLGISFSELCDRYDVENISDKLFIIHNDEKCPFLKDNLCEIQSIKPLFCKLYIPAIEPDYTPTYQQCPGVGIGKEYTQEEIDQINQNMCDNFNFIIKEGE